MMIYVVSLHWLHSNEKNGDQMNKVKPTTIPLAIDIDDTVLNYRINDGIDVQVKEKVKEFCKYNGVNEEDIYTTITIDVNLHINKTLR